MSSAPMEPLPLIPPTGPRDVNVPVVTSADLAMFFFVLTGAANTSSFRVSGKINSCCFPTFPRLLGKGLQGPTYLVLNLSILGSWRCGQRPGGMLLGTLDFEIHRSDLRNSF